VTFLISPKQIFDWWLVTRVGNKSNMFAVATCAFFGKLGNVGQEKNCLSCYATQQCHREVILYFRSRSNAPQNQKEKYISRKKDLRQTLQQCYRFCVVTPQRKID
jgi:hypothetical protein